jgi:alkylation response protein AidB-like acyl-CoA dehydrogenase
MDFLMGDAADQLAGEVRDFLATELTDEIHDEVHRTGTHHDAGFIKQMADRHWVAPGWPADEGGLGLGHLQGHVLWEEMQYAGAPLHGMGTSRIVAGVIRALGTNWLKERILPPFLAGDILLVQAWTEPEVGSDVAAVRTAAVRDGDGWVINGSKMFTTNAHVADYALLLARTDTTVAKHRGLTTFLVPLDSPGIEVRAVHTVSGERTNITFYDDVRIGDEWRVGEVNGGWTSMTTGLTLERAQPFGGTLRSLRDRLEAGVRSGAVPAGPATSARIGRITAAAEISMLMGRRAAWVEETGGSPGLEGSMGKLYESEAVGTQAAAVADLLGPEGLRRPDDPAAPLAGWPEQLLRTSLGMTIYAGTSEIQRGIIAERGLGLPKGR